MLLKAGGTVVVLMGLERLADIVKYLTESGCSPQTPAAAIAKATWPEQEVRFATLQSIDQGRELKSPALLVWAMSSNSLENVLRINESSFESADGCSSGFAQHERPPRLRR